MMSENCLEGIAYIYSILSRREDTVVVNKLNLDQDMREGCQNEVTMFIDEFYEYASMSERELRKLFRAGYCWHFAHMLQATFDRGDVCWAAPFGHFVWCDTDGTPYDIEGEYCGEAYYYVPERYLGEALNDFKHIPGKYFNASLGDLTRILNDYLKEQNKMVVLTRGAEGSIELTELPQKSV